MKEPAKIKHLIPIPEHLAILTPVEQEDGSCILEDMTEYGWPQVMALIDGVEDADDYMVLYQAELTGVSMLIDSYSMVYKRRCPKCHSVMHVYMASSDAGPIDHLCECGHHYRVSEQPNMNCESEVTTE